MRRRLRSDDTLDAEVIRRFTSACDDRFTRSWFGDPLFETTAEAREAWPRYRLAVWAQTPRMRVPRAAKVFDDLTRGGWDALWWTKGHIRFPLGEVLTAIEADRAAAVAFERRDPKAARAIGDYLARWRDDLDELCGLAHLVARDPYAAGVHHRMVRSETYGHAEDDAA